ncbi:MAG: RNA-binding protein [Spirochaetia bacterium]|nr:RNA-binding protein [Spirochaetia bacterium]
MNIYVGNLSYSITETELRNAFSKFGDIVSINIITDKFTNQPKGFAFVEMGSKESGVKAISELNGIELNSREIIVNEAKPKKPVNNNQRQNSNRW